MDMITAFVIVAMLATVVSLVAGIRSMAIDGEVGHLSSAQWMVRRVEFQGLAFVLILIALLNA